MLLRTADVESPLVAASALAAAGNRVLLSADSGEIVHTSTGRNTQLLRRGGTYILRMWIPSKRPRIFLGREADADTFVCFVPCKTRGRCKRQRLVARRVSLCQPLGIPEESVRSDPEVDEDPCAPQLRREQLIKRHTSHVVPAARNVWLAGATTHHTNELLVRTTQSIKS